MFDCIQSDQLLSDELYEIRGKTMRIPLDESDIELLFILQYIPIKYRQA